MADLVEMSFGDLGDLFDGPHATPVRRQSGPYFLNISSLQSGRLNLAESDHVSPEDFSKWTRRVTPRAGDLLFSYETRLGEAALMVDGVEACLGRRMALLRPNLSIVDPRFLLYYYLSPGFQRIIATNAIHGATVSRIGLAAMPKWHVEIPELARQRAIAEVLGALDDKIAANDRASALADDLARSRYHLHVASRPTSRMSDVLVPLLGGTPTRSDSRFWDGAVPWVSAKDVTSASHGVIRATSEGISQSATRVARLRPLPVGSVVLTARGTVGRVARLDVAASINQSCYGFVPGRLPAGALRFVVEAASDQARALAHGSVFDTITMRTFDHVLIPDLTDDEWNGIEGDVRPLLGLVSGLVRENSVLAKTRDELLPLMMSGKVRVRDAEKRVEEVL
ncbi:MULTISPECIES: restriction endonuclease subunit S [unclassified Isoptericola]|uniref:restriction endonuclease subunit S n=1 Tax=unclassified Isoptericola TaxID=2623355 RepID=UPI00365BE448